MEVILFKPVIRAYVVENTAAVYGNILPAKVPYHVFTVAGQDTISAISDTTLNNYFMLHGLKTGTYKVEFHLWIPISCLPRQMSTYLEAQTKILGNHQSSSVTTHFALPIIRKAYLFYTISFLSYFFFVLPFK